MLIISIPEVLITHLLNLLYFGKIHLKLVVLSIKFNHFGMSRDSCNDKFWNSAKSFVQNYTDCFHTFLRSNLWREMLKHTGIPCHWLLEDMFSHMWMMSCRWQIKDLVLIGSISVSSEKQTDSTNWVFNIINLMWFLSSRVSWDKWELSLT